MDYLDQKTLKLVREEVDALFPNGDMKKFKTFKNFFDEIDTINSYEPDWGPEKFKKYFEAIWYEKLYGMEI